MSMYVYFVHNLLQTGATPLHVAALHGDAALASLLIAAVRGRAAAILAESSDGRTREIAFAPWPAHRTAANLIVGALLDLRDASGWTPLHAAVHAGSLAVVEILLREGSVRDAVDGRGVTAAAYAGARTPADPNAVPSTAVPLPSAVSLYGADGTHSRDTQAAAVANAGARVDAGTAAAETAADARTKAILRALLRTPLSQHSVSDAASPMPRISPLIGTPLPTAVAARRVAMLTERGGERLAKVLLAQRVVSPPAQGGLLMHASLDANVGEGDVGAANINLPSAEVNLAARNCWSQPAYLPPFRVVPITRPVLTGVPRAVPHVGGGAAVRHAARRRHRQFDAPSTCSGTSNGEGSDNVGRSSGDLSDNSDASSYSTSNDDGAIRNQDDAARQATRIDAASPPAATATDAATNTGAGDAFPHAPDVRATLGTESSTLPTASDNGTEPAAQSSDLGPSALRVLGWGEAGTRRLSVDMGVGCRGGVGRSIDVVALIAAMQAAADGVDEDEGRTAQRRRVAERRRRRLYGVTGNGTLSPMWSALHILVATSDAADIVATAQLQHSHDMAGVPRRTTSTPAASVALTATPRATPSTTGAEARTAFVNDRTDGTTQVPMPGTTTSMASSSVRRGSDVDGSDATVELHPDNKHVSVHVSPADADTTSQQLKNPLRGRTAALGQCAVCGAPNCTCGIAAALSILPLIAFDLSTTSYVAPSIVRDTRSSDHAVCEVACEVACVQCNALAHATLPWNDFSFRFGAAAALAPTRYHRGLPQPTVGLRRLAARTGMSAVASIARPTHVGTGTSSTAMFTAWRSVGNRVTETIAKAVPVLSGGDNDVVGPLLRTATVSDEAVPRLWPPSVGGDTSDEAAYSSDGAAEAEQLAKQRGAYASAQGAVDVSPSDAQPCETLAQPRQRQQNLAAAGAAASALGAGPFNFSGVGGAPLATLGAPTMLASSPETYALETRGLSEQEWSGATSAPQSSANVGHSVTAIGHTFDTAAYFGPGGTTPLHLAAVLHNPSSAHALLSAGAGKALVRDAADSTPLHAAARAGATETFFVLLDAAATAVHAAWVGACACSVQHYGLFRDCGALPNIDAGLVAAAARRAVLSIRDINGQTPLDVAALYGSRGVVAQLAREAAVLSADALLGPLEGLSDVVDEYGVARAPMRQARHVPSALHYAAAAGHADVVRILLRLRVDCAARAAERHAHATVLHVAAPVQTAPSLREAVGHTAATTTTPVHATSPAVQRGSPINVRRQQGTTCHEKSVHFSPADTHAQARGGLSRKSELAPSRCHLPPSYFFASHAFPGASSTSTIRRKSQCRSATRGCPPDSIAAAVDRVNELEGIDVNIPLCVADAVARAARVLDAVGTDWRMCDDIAASALGLPFYFPARDVERHPSRSPLHLAAAAGSTASCAAIIAAAAELAATAHDRAASRSLVSTATADGSSPVTCTCADSQPRLASTDEARKFAAAAAQCAVILARIPFVRQRRNQEQTASPPMRHRRHDAQPVLPSVLETAGRSCVGEALATGHEEAALLMLAHLGRAHQLPETVVFTPVGDLQPWSVERDRLKFLPLNLHPQIEEWGSTGAAASSSGIEISPVEEGVGRAVRLSPAPEASVGVDARTEHRDPPASPASCARIVSLHAERGTGRSPTPPAPESSSTQFWSPLGVPPASALLRDPSDGADGEDLHASYRGSPSLLLPHLSEVLGTGWGDDAEEQHHGRVEQEQGEPLIPVINVSAPVTGNLTGPMRRLIPRTLTALTVQLDRAAVWEKVVKWGASHSNSAKRSGGGSAPEPTIGAASGAPVALSSAKVTARRQIDSPSPTAVEVGLDTPGAVIVIGAACVLAHAIQSTGCGLSSSQRRVSPVSPTRIPTALALYLASCARGKSHAVSAIRRVPGTGQLPAAVLPVLPPSAPPFAVSPALRATLGSARCFDSESRGLVHDAAAGGCVDALRLLLACGLKASDAATGTQLVYEAQLCWFHHGLHSAVSSRLRRSPRPPILLSSMVRNESVELQQHSEAMRRMVAPSPVRETPSGRRVPSLADFRMASRDAIRRREPSAQSPVGSVDGDSPPVNSAADGADESDADNGGFTRAADEVLRLTAGGRPPRDDARIRARYDGAPRPHVTASMNVPIPTAAVLLPYRPMLRNAAHEAALAGHASVLQLLAAVDPACLTEADVNGDTPLHLAALRGHASAVRILLTGSADTVSRAARTRNDTCDSLLDDSDDASFDNDAEPDTTQMRELELIEPFARLHPSRRLPGQATERGRRGRRRGRARSSIVDVAGAMLSVVPRLTRQPTPWSLTELRDVSRERDGRARADATSAHTRDRAGAFSGHTHAYEAAQRANGLEVAPRASPPMRPGNVTHANQREGGGTRGTPEIAHRGGGVSSMVGASAMSATTPPGGSSAPSAASAAASAAAVFNAVFSAVSQGMPAPWVSRPPTHIVDTDDEERSHAHINQTSPPPARGLPPLRLNSHSFRLTTPPPTVRLNAALTARNADDATPLHAASIGGCAVTVALLIAAGGAVSAEMKDSCLSLHIAAFEGNAAVAALLLALGSDADHLSAEKHTALHESASNGFADVCAVLVRGVPRISVSMITAELGESVPHCMSDDATTAATIDSAFTAPPITERSDDSTPQQPETTLGTLAVSADSSPDSRVMPHHLWPTVVRDAMHARNAPPPTSPSLRPVSRLLPMLPMLPPLASWGQQRPLQPEQHDFQLEQHNSQPTFGHMQQHPEQQRLLPPPRVTLVSRTRDSFGAIYAMARPPLATPPALISPQQHLHTAATFAFPAAIPATNINGVAAAALWSRRANVDACDAGDDTPLHWAVCHNNACAAMALVANGASLTKTNIDGGCGLHAAAINGSIDCLVALIAAGADVNTRFRQTAGGGTRDTALHVVAGDGRVACTELLLRAGAELNPINARGRTPLHEACRSHARGCIEALLQAGADVSIEDENGRTPLGNMLPRSRAVALVRPPAADGGRDYPPALSSALAPAAGIFVEDHSPWRHGGGDGADATATRKRGTQPTTTTGSTAANAARSRVAIRSFSDVLTRGLLPSLMEAVSLGEDEYCGRDAAATAAITATVPTDNCDDATVAVAPGLDTLACLLAEPAPAQAAAQQATLASAGFAIVGVPVVMDAPLPTAPGLGAAGAALAMRQRLVLAAAAGGAAAAVPALSIGLATVHASSALSLPLHVAVLSAHPAARARARNALGERAARRLAGGLAHLAAVATGCAVGFERMPFPDPESDMPPLPPSVLIAWARAGGFDADLGDDGHDASSVGATDARGVPAAAGFPHVPPATSFTSIFAGFWRDGLYTDVTLMTPSGVGLRAHRALLAARCPALHALFSLGMAETGRDVVHVGMGIDALGLLLTWLYTGRVPPRALLAAAAASHERSAVAAAGIRHDSERGSHCGNGDRCDGSECCEERVPAALSPALLALGLCECGDAYALGGLVHVAAGLAAQFLTLEDLPTVLSWTMQRGASALELRAACIDYFVSVPVSRVVAREAAVAGVHALSAVAQEQQQPRRGAAVRDGNNHQRPIVVEPPQRPFATVVSDNGGERANRFAIPMLPLPTAARGDASTVDAITEYDGSTTRRDVNCGVRDGIGGSTYAHSPLARAEYAALQALRRQQQGAHGRITAALPLPPAVATLETAAVVQPEPQRDDALLLPPMTPIAARGTACPLFRTPLRSDGGGRASRGTPLSVHSASMANVLSLARDARSGSLTPADATERVSALSGIGGGGASLHRSSSDGGCGDAATPMWRARVACHAAHSDASSAQHSGAGAGVLSNSGDPSDRRVSHIGGTRVPSSPQNWRAAATLHGLVVDTSELPQQLSASEPSRTRPTIVVDSHPSQSGAPYEDVRATTATEHGAQAVASATDERSPAAYTSLASADLQTEPVAGTGLETKDANEDSADDDCDDVESYCDVDEIVRPTSNVLEQPHNRAVVGVHDSPPQAPQLTSCIVPTRHREVAPLLIASSVARSDAIDCSLALRRRLRPRRETIVALLHEYREATDGSDSPRTAAMHYLQPYAPLLSMLLDPTANGVVAIEWDKKRAALVNGHWHDMRRAMGGGLPRSAPGMFGAAGGGAADSGFTRIQPSTSRQWQRE